MQGFPSLKVCRHGNRFVGRILSIYKQLICLKCWKALQCTNIHKGGNSCLWPQLWQGTTATDLVKTRILQPHRANWAQGFPWSTISWMFVAKTLTLKLELADNSGPIWLTHIGQPSKSLKWSDAGEASQSIIWWIKEVIKNKAPPWSLSPWSFVQTKLGSHRGNVVKIWTCPNSRQMLQKSLVNPSTLR